MSPVPSAAKEIRFGPFQLDVKTGQLRKGCSAVRLQPQPAMVLALLASRAGDVVSREEIRREVWGGDTFVDFQQGVNFCIRQLRAALGDEAAGPRYIETLPRRGYRFLAAVEVPPPAPVAAAGRIMLAVLPFENLSGDPGQEYFSDGLTEEMIARLGRLDPGRMGVIARTSSMKYKRVHRSVREIGRELGVGYLLEGSVRRDGDRVRITAQLVQAGDETHLWAGQYDRPLRDVLAVQAEVAGAIAGEIRLRLSRQERERLAGAMQVHPEAYQAYLKGRFFWNLRTRMEGFTKSIRCFQRALELDPGFALAWSGLADAYTLMGFYGYAPTRQANPRARAAALKALEIDEGLSEAHASLALACMDLDWDWRRASREFRRALELNPSNPDAHHWHSHLLAAMGRFEESLAAGHRALELDPLDLHLGVHLAWSHCFARRYDAAIDQCRSLLELDARQTWPHLLLGLSWSLKGSHARAASALEKAVALSRGLKQNMEALWTLGYVRAMAGRAGEARRTLIKMGALAGRRHGVAFGEALVHGALGERDTAFGRLDAAFGEGSGYLLYLMVDPRLDGLRDDARFAALVRRVGLPA